MWSRFKSEHLEETNLLTLGHKPLVLDR